MDLAIINQELHEASLMNEDLAHEDLDAVPTDRSSVKVSMIKKNNEIIYQDHMLVQEEQRESEMEKVRRTYQRHVLSRRRGDTLGDSSSFAMMPPFKNETQMKLLSVSQFEIPLKKSNRNAMPRLMSAKPPIAGSFNSS
jgi:hypothetical protein